MKIVGVPTSKGSAKSKPPGCLALGIFVAAYIVLFAIGCALWALAVWASVWAAYKVGLPLP